MMISIRKTSDQHWRVLIQDPPDCEPPHPSRLGLVGLQGWVGLRLATYFRRLADRAEEVVGQLSEVGGTERAATGCRR